MYALMFLTALSAHVERLRFEHLSTQHGLSQISVYAIAQDHHEFLWFGTEDGLKPFDGYSFRVYRHNPLELHLICSLFERRMS
jgi:ligand-binding sensor domain-containing protein